jgi:transcriptional regulator with XRE-family HTH domain
MKKSFSTYLRQQIKAQGLSVAKIAELAGMSRQNLYKILSGDVSQARMTTMIKLAHALDIHPLYLFRKFLASYDIAIQDSSFEDTSFRTQSFHAGDDVGFIKDVNYPDNSLVNTGKTFEKIWKIQNTGRIGWKSRKLICIDEILPLLECKLNKD